MEWNNNHESKQKERKKTQNREEQSDVLHLLQDVVEDEVMSAPQPSVPKLFAWLHVSVDSDLLPQVGYFVR